MKKLILLLTLLALPAFATCTSPCINHAAVFCAGFGSTCPTSGVDMTGANFCYVTVGAFIAGPSTVVDNYGNTYTPLTAYTTGNPTQQRGYYVANASTGAGFIWTLNNSFSNSATLAGACFSGIRAVSPLFSQNGTASSVNSASAQDGTMSPPANSLLVSGVGVDVKTISSVDSGFNITDQISSGSSVGAGLAYLFQAGTTSQSPTWTLSGSTDWAVGNAVFQTGGTFVSNPTLITGGP